ncbi:MAG TPA: gamma-glutamyl-gamma-aminobutyrate hydrolase family protein [Candidatus Saccharimonadales bacterium]|nr:gamma-glutamyl-gamma-aminobutyrate hydrolase family protein [Candidatus Saccharimonadales bacterium]
MSKSNRIAILDAGGQYVDLVKKAVVRLGIPADVLPLSTKRSMLEAGYGAIIISGSPASSHVETAPQPELSIWDSGLPILGICYGMQSMVVAHGGSVSRNAIREDGRVVTGVDTGHQLFQGTKPRFSALFTHGDFVRSLPEGFSAIGQHKLSDGSQAISAIAKGNKLGVQFHPEVFDDTPEGYVVFKNFIKIAHLTADDKFRNRQLNNLIKAKTKLIKSQAADKNVIAFVSGGVDSSVSISLASRVLDSNKLHAFFIDHGFMRDEDSSVIRSLTDQGIIVRQVNAADYFAEASIKIGDKRYGPLKRVVDPEIKRKIIGKCFIDFQNKLVAELGLDGSLLLQGTNAADRIESGHSQGDGITMTIKTHHNQVQEARQMKEEGRLIEPLDDLFKDEIRELGRALGLPPELVGRHPFPGPGLAIRILAMNRSEKVKDEGRNLNKIQSYLNNNKILTPAHLLPIRSVGVGGDERSHLYAAALDYGSLSIGELENAGSGIPAHFPELVNRVVYSLSKEKINSLYLSKTHLTESEIDQLRQADRITFEELRKSGLINKITQFPVVLLPVSINSPGNRSIVLRPVKTTTFMTAQAMHPNRDLSEVFLHSLAQRITKEVAGISHVFLDITNKPPGTIEWE